MDETFPRSGMPEVNFVEVDPDKIKNELLKIYTDITGRTLADGDPVQKFILVLAYMFTHFANEYNTGCQQNLVTYARGKNLDALGFNSYTERLPEAHALTTLEFHLTQELSYDYIIPAGLEVTNGTIIFATNEDLTIPAGKITGEILATCTTGGVIGNNCPKNTINTIVTPLPYVLSANNISISSGGADTESDAEYYERILLAPEQFSTGGSEAAYLYQARKFSSAIIDVKSHCPEDEPCHVYIYPLMTGGEIPTDDIINGLYDWLIQSKIKVATDVIHVKKPEAVEYEINLGYYIHADNIRRVAAISENIEKAVQEYIAWQQHKIGRAISPAELIYRVKNAGAYDVDLTTLLPQDKNLTYKQIAQCSGINIVYMGAIL